MASKSFCVLALAAALLVGPGGASSLFAQDGKQIGARSDHPIGLDVAYEWQYSCPEGRGCSFTCPGAGGATNVMKLNMYLGSIPVGKTEHATGVFYEFTSMHVPTGNGFAVTTGLSTLACQVQGMKLDRSGPADMPTAAVSTAR